MLVFIESLVLGEVMLCDNELLAVLWHFAHIHVMCKCEVVGAHTEVPTTHQLQPFTPAHRAWITKDRTQPGHIGEPSAANAEKGEILLQTFAADVVSLLGRVLAWDGREWNA